MRFWVLSEATFPWHISCQLQRAAKLEDYLYVFYGIEGIGMLGGLARVAGAHFSVWGKHAVAACVHAAEPLPDCMHMYNYFTWI
jgi:hypothetical protein